MTKKAIDADAIVNAARPLTDQQAHEIQPFGHLVKPPIALAERVRTEGVENLNRCRRTRSRCGRMTSSSTRAAHVERH
jgi:hypothetical protein